MKLQNNKIRILLVATIAVITTIGSLTITSCEKEKYSVNSTSTPVPNGVKLQKLGNTERQYFAELLAASLYENMQVFIELNKAIHFITTEYGMDENLTFYDVMNTDKSVFLTSSSSVELLRSAFDQNDILKMFNLSEDNFYMNLQFYWPYHDKWDMSSIPTICFAPEDDDEEETIGFRYKDGDVITIPIHKDDIDYGDHSLIIISEGEVKYTDYPDFKNGKWEKNGCSWSNPKLLNFIMGLVSFENSSNTANRVYEAKSKTLKSSGTQYDNWGGSEFYLQAAYAINNSTAVTKGARVNFTRDDIKEQKMKVLGLFLQNNWQPQYENIHLVLVEEDGWEIWTEDISVNLSVSGVSISTTIHVGNDDDEISNDIVSRDNYINACNNDNGKLELGSEALYCSMSIYDSYSNY